MNKIPDEILVNILEYISIPKSAEEAFQQIRLLRVSKTFYRLAIETFYFNPIYVYQACKYNNLRIAKLHKENIIKTLPEAEDKRCLTISIRNNNIDCVKTYIRSDIDDAVINVSLSSTRRIAQLILDEFFIQNNTERKKKQRKNVLKLMIKTCGNIRQIYKFKSYLLVLAYELTNEEFLQILDKSDLDKPNKNFIIQITNRNIKYYKDYIKISKQFGDFIKRSVHDACLRYFYFIEDKEMIKLLNKGSIKHHVVIDKIKMNNIFNLKYDRDYFKKALKYHSENALKSMIDSHRFSKNDFMFFLENGDWYVSDIFSAINQRLYNKTTETLFLSRVNNIAEMLEEVSEDELGNMIESINNDLGFEIFHLEEANEANEN